MADPSWSLKVPMLSIHPEAASPADVARLASELMDCRHVLSKIKTWCEIHNVAGKDIYKPVCKVLEGS